MQNSPFVAAASIAVCPPISTLNASGLQKVYAVEVRTKGNQTGTVRERYGNFYGSFFRWVPEPDGTLKWKRKEVTLKATNRRAADKELMDEYITPSLKVGMKGNTDESAITLKRFVDEVFMSEHVAKKRQSGQDHYKYQLLHIIPSLGGMRMADITPSLVQALIDAKSKSGLKSQSCKHIRNALSAIYKRAVFHRLVSADMVPTKGVSMPPDLPEEPHALTPAQSSMFLDAIPKKYKAAILFFLETGARSSELAGMRWPDINLEDCMTADPVHGQTRWPRTIHFRHGWKFKKYVPLKTKASKRNVEMTPELLEAMKALYAARDVESDIVFTAVRGKNTVVPMVMQNLLQRVVKPLGVKLGMPWITLHGFRHTYATALEEAGGANWKVSKQEIGAKMGHASSEATERYLHSDDVERRAPDEPVSGRRTMVA